MDVSIKQLYLAALQCRRGKRQGFACQRYEARLIDYLYETQRALQSKQYQNRPMRLFMASNGSKPREIHAAHYADRVVHHYLVPRLERMIAPKFIYDSAANQKNKGTHFAVNRLQKMMRQYDASLKQGVAVYYLQLDIHNFFYSVDKKILLALLARHFKTAIAQHAIGRQQARDEYWLCQQILKRGKTVIAGIKYPVKTQLPAHKCWVNLAVNKGIPVGNLSSQFFSNVYLHELDLFIKHHLKVKHYVRYVDDFIMLHQDKQQLQAWQQAIEVFLATHLALKLKAGSKQATVTQGVDFLGYIIYPHYKRVRKRILGNLYARLQRWQQQWIDEQTDAVSFELNIEAVAQIYSVLASYSGHFNHAQAYDVIREKQQQFPWLAGIFRYDPSAQQWQSVVQLKQAQRLLNQWQFFQQHPFSLCIIMQKGCRWLISHAVLQKVGSILSCYYPSPWQSPLLWEVDGDNQSRVIAELRRQRCSYGIVTESGYAHARLKQRYLTALWQVK